MNVAKQVEPGQVFIGKAPELLDGVKFRQIRIVDNILFRQPQFWHQKSGLLVNAKDQLLFGHAIFDFRGVEIFLILFE